MKIGKTISLALGLAAGAALAATAGRSYKLLDWKNAGKRKKTPKSFDDSEAHYI